jgi:lipoyl(octanoyl) transferase
VTAGPGGKIPATAPFSTREEIERVTAGPDEPDFVYPRPLSAYLLGGLAFDTLLALQRRLVYDISGDRDSAALVLCDHPTGVTIGREGSSAHVRPNPDELHLRGWPVRWVARGGGAVLHVPGQVACYPIFALDQLHITAGRFVSELVAVGCDLCREFGVAAAPDPDRPGVRANARRLMHVGVAVRGSVTSFGLIVNATPDLAPFRDVRCDGDPLPMTSLARESPLRVRVTTVRQRLLELIVKRFRFDRVSVFHTHPAALPRPTRHAIPHGS